MSFLKGHSILLKLLLLCRLLQRQLRLQRLRRLQGQLKRKLARPTRMVMWWLQWTPRPTPVQSPEIFVASLPLRCASAPIACRLWALCTSMPIFMHKLEALAVGLHQGSPHSIGLAFRCAGRGQRCRHCRT